MKKKPINQYYDKVGPKEWRRLVKDPFHRLEFETTLHFLEKHLPKKGLILDAGGGPGRYTIELAKQGYDLVLLDISPKLLEIAKKRIAKAGVKKKVKQIVKGSITDLSMFKNNQFDAVVCLGGPLSHVEGEKNRKKAVAELTRVAKKNTPIFISVMGRLGVLSILPRYFPEEISMTKVFKDTWKTGEHYLWGGGYYCHFFLPEELKELIRSADLKIIEKVGLEGLASSIEKEINHLAKNDPKAWKNWLESHYALCTHPAVFALSGHMLIVGKK